MIDTVSLTLQSSKVILMDENNKTIPSWDLFARTDSYTKYVRNPSKREKDTGLYFPRLTSYSRKYQAETLIRIEFSVPKLIYKNNVEELSDNDFSLVIETLQDRLKRMGIHVFKKNLEDASVSSVHFGRNFIFTNGHTATGIISQLGRIDLRKSFDFARSRYINDGQSLCCHTSSHELVFYDKIADLKKGKKRSIDRDSTVYQTTLFDHFKSNKQKIAILRMEVRLTRKTKLNALFKKLNLPINPTFHAVFSVEVSNKILWEYWLTLILTKNEGVLLMAEEPSQILKRIFLLNPDIKVKQSIFLTGLMLLSQSGNGLRDLREHISCYASDRTWSRIMKDYRQLSSQISEHRIRSWVKDIESQLKNYKPFKIT